MVLDVFVCLTCLCIWSACLCAVDFSGGSGSVNHGLPACTLQLYSTCSLNTALDMSELGRHVIRPHQVIYLSYRHFGIYPNEAGRINIIIFLKKLARSKAHLRPSCSPVTHQEALHTESLKTQVVLNNQGGGRKVRSWQCIRNNTQIFKYFYFNFPGFKCGGSVRQIYNLVWPY